MQFGYNSQWARCALLRRFLIDEFAEGLAFLSNLLDSPTPVRKLVIQLTHAKAPHEGWSSLVDIPPKIQRNTTVAYSNRNI